MPAPPIDQEGFDPTEKKMDILLASILIREVIDIAENAENPPPPISTKEEARLVAIFLIQKTINILQSTY